MSCNWPLLHSRMSESIQQSLHGRLSKFHAGKLYHFSIQSNTVCGEDGVCRFAVVPKNISCGSNFGLTNLLMALWRAKEKGRIGQHVTRLVRHTDGGSDNVSEITHVFHWLLVYIGFVDEILWFRFEAGHSHTEIADRFFALMKKIFETDSNARVREGVKDFAELEARMADVFRNIPEEFFFEYASPEPRMYRLPPYSPRPPVSPVHQSRPPQSSSLVPPLVQVQLRQLGY